MERLQSVPKRDREKFAKKVLGQSMLALSHIHKENFCHGNLSPESIGFAKCGVDEVFKIANFDSCKKLNVKVENPWTSIVSNSPQPSKHQDILQMAHIVHIMLTHGMQPFGDNKKEAGTGKLNLSSVLKPLPKDLLIRILSVDEVTPTADVILRHPFLWDSVDRFDFLWLVSNRLEKERKKLIPNTAQNIESYIRGVQLFVRNWKSKIPSFAQAMEDEARLVSQGSKAIKENLPPFYDEVSVVSLLRLIRNTKSHLETFERIHPNTSVEEFFEEKFPDLFIGIYKVILLYCRKEDWFMKFEEKRSLVFPH